MRIIGGGATVVVYQNTNFDTDKEGRLVIFSVEIVRSFVRLITENGCHSLGYIDILMFQRWSIDHVINFIFISNIFIIYSIVNFIFQAHKKLLVLFPPDIPPGIN